MFEYSWLLRMPQNSHETAVVSVQKSHFCALATAVWRARSASFAFSFGPSGKIRVSFWTFPGVFPFRMESL